MSTLTTLVFGPLAGPECRRALARGWLTLVRALAASAVLGVMGLVLWYWWLGGELNPDHRPLEELQVGLMVAEILTVILGLLLAPAVLAGSLAGERERGALALLLTTRVSAREVVSGRLAGKLAQVGMIQMAGLPALALLGGLLGLGAAGWVALLALPVAVGLGAGGLAAAASVVSRRGRDALLAVYMVEALLVLTPLLGWLYPSQATSLLARTDPFGAAVLLVRRGEAAPALSTSAFWLAMGALGAAAACSRLRPVCLGSGGGEPARAGKARRRRWAVPPVDEARPMLWKELYVERVGTLGRFGRWAGLLLVVVLSGGSAGLAAAVFYSEFRGDFAASEWCRGALDVLAGGSGVVLSCLVQWAVGLRAAVTISSERERETWDALLTSPLDAGSIIRAKVWGSLAALRWLAGAVVFAWVMAAVVGVSPVGEVVWMVIGLAVGGAFMAAVGVRTSLSCRTATRAMSVTIGVWLGSVVVFAVGAVVVLGTLAVFAFAVSALAQQLGYPLMGGLVGLPGFVLRHGWSAAVNALTLLATLLVVADTRLRFDRLAGRQTEGAVAVALDDLIYAHPTSPAPADRRPPPVNGAAGAGAEAAAVSPPAGTPVHSE